MIAYISQGLGSGTARVEKAIEVYEVDRDRFAALSPDEQRLEMYGHIGPHWPELRQLETRDEKVARLKKLVTGLYEG